MDTTTPAMPLRRTRTRTTSARSTCRPWGLPNVWVCGPESARQRRTAHDLASVALVVAVIGLSGAGPASRSLAARSSAQAEVSRTPVQIVWPLPPDVPRVKYVGQYASSVDVEGEPRKSATFKIKEALLGKDRVAGERPGALRFAKPYGLAVDSKGRIFVADTERATVFVLDPPNKRFLYIGAQERQIRFRVPIGVAVDGQDNVYVSDNGHKAIFVFGPDLRYRSTLTKAGDVEAPTSIAVDPGLARLYAVDTRRHALLSYDLGSARLLAKTGQKGDKPGEFGWPSGVAVGPDGRVYVSDTMNYRVQVFDGALHFVRSFGSLGVQPGQFRRPKGIAVDRDKIVYVVDSDFSNFQMFDDEGRVLLYVGSYGASPGQMIMPAGIAVPWGQRRIYVAEQITKRVQVFERVDSGPGPDPPRAPANRPH